MPSAVCPVHGLRFDPAAGSGCSRCRPISVDPPRGFSRRRVLAGCAAVGALGAAALAARISRKGSPQPTSDIREVNYATGHRGAFLEPAQLDPAIPRPVVLLFDPLGNARGIVDRYARAARQHGWLAASTFEVADGTPDDADTNAMMSLLDYVRSRHAVEVTQIFTGGFSGGGCGAYRLAIVKSEVFAGAIVECGHMAPWREVGDMASRSLRFYLFTRDGDFNRPATRRLKDAMLAKRCRVAEVERAGGHAPMEDAEVSEAMDWMEAP
jgi:predicted esterase